MLNTRDWLQKRFLHRGVYSPPARRCTQIYVTCNWTTFARQLQPLDDSSSICNSVDDIIIGLASSWMQKKFLISGMSIDLKLVCSSPNNVCMSCKLLWKDAPENLQKYLTGSLWGDP